MTSNNGARWTCTLSVGLHRTVHSGNGESDRHWTPTGESPQGMMDESHKHVHCLDERGFVLNCHEKNVTIKINK